MMTTRMPHTGRQMEQSGDRCKVGRKHYLHGSGREIRYNHNRWLWEIVGTDIAYSLLWPAKYAVEKMARDNEQPINPNTTPGADRP